MVLAVHGIGTVSALGAGTDQFRRGLQGRAPDTVPMHLEEGCVLPVYQPRLEGIDAFFSPRALRRVDEFSTMALLSAALAIRDSGLDLEGKKVGVVFGSGYGPLKTTFQFLDNIIDDGDAFASPQHFAASVHNAPASQISAVNHFQGPCATITTFSDTVSGVLTTAQCWLDTNQAEYVLAGFGDEHCHVLYYTAEAMGSGDHVLNPLDTARCTYLPGGGAVSFLLSTGNGRTGGGHIALEGFSVEARHISLQTLGHPDGIILSARGHTGESAPFSGVSLGDCPVTAYTPLFGAFPVSAAMDMAGALIGLRDGLFYPGPFQSFGNSRFTLISSPRPLNPDALLCILEPAGSDRLHHYRITQ
jgi:3-oxoacyl-[acyl-carrier-protein] synthase II